MTSLRFMVVAYYWRQQAAQIREIMESAAGLVRTELNELRKQVDIEHQEISRVKHGDNWQRMSTIRQQQSEDEDMEGSTGVFNRLIGGMKAVARKASESFTMYKEELKKLAGDFCGLEQKNKDLQTKLTKLKRKFEEQEIQPPPLFPENVASTANLPKEDRRAWEQLNHKIENLKKSLKLYEDEIREKDALIASLKEENRAGDSDKFEKDNKQLKRTLTTLRGEKSMLGSQLDSLKKVLHSRENIIEAQTVELNRNRADLESLSSALKETTDQLSELKAGYKDRVENSSTNARKIEKLEAELKAYTEKYPRADFDRLRSDNERLSNSLSEAQSNYRQLLQKLGEIESRYKQIGTRDKQTIDELQRMLAQKNETIVQLKASRTDDKYEYYVELVKLLNRKLLDRDAYIQELKQKQ